VLDVPVSEVILNEPSICALIGQGEAASVAQHVAMDEQGRGSGAQGRRRKMGALRAERAR
jgi:hypothetical protein